MLGRVLHVLCAAVLLLAIYVQRQLYPELSWLTLVAAATFIAALVYQHSIVKARDLSRVNLAFFTTNGLASLLFGSLAILDIFV